MKPQQILAKHRTPYVYLGLSTTTKPPLCCLEFLEVKEPRSLLRRHFHALSLENHPDKGGDERRFKDVLRAFEYLDKNSHFKNHDAHYTKLLLQAQQQSGSSTDQDETQQGAPGAEARSDDAQEELFARFFRFVRWEMHGEAEPLSPGGCCRRGAPCRSCAREIENEGGIARDILSVVDRFLEELGF